MKKYTIIICSYNGSKRLEKVVKKIYEQNQLEDYIEELIVVDNNSTDDTKSIIYKCASEFVKVPIRYVYEEKAGLSNARRAGIKACKTKWIVFLDDDNYVSENWLEEINNYVELHPNVGALNGAVIPYIGFKATQNEIENLNASLKVLACTHLNVDELRKNPKSPFRNPIGAGLVILAEPLKELEKKGWLKSAGRTKDNLVSGEDGEMAFWVKNQGFDFGFCSKAVLYHEMTSQRLQDEYLQKMWYEIGRGVAVVARNQNNRKLKKFLYQGLLFARLISYYFCNSRKAKYYRIYIKGYKNEISM